MKLKPVATVLLFIFLLMGCTSEEHLIFNNLEEAVNVIGKIKIPSGIGSDYEIEQITYDNDGFTHPVTKVFLKKEIHQVTFMIASSFYDECPSVKINHETIDEMVWITNDHEYVLKWRSSNQESYKYLISADEKDRDWFIKIAESYETKEVKAGNVIDLKQIRLGQKIGSMTVESFHIRPTGKGI